MKLAKNQIAFIVVLGVVGVIIAVYVLGDSSRMGENTMLVIFGTVTIIFAAMLLLRHKGAGSYGIAQL